jgi:YVTN family beta-propeller protein
MISPEKGGRVTTIAGTHDLPQGMSLFAFGDRDGKGGEARLQHCLGVAYADGTLFVADSYNNKVKAIDLATRTVTTLVGTRSGGRTDDPPQFDEPGGLSVAGGSLYVADTNNHAIRVVDLATRKVRTLALEGVEQPRPPVSPPRFPNAVITRAGEARVAPGDHFALAVTVPLPEGFEINPDAPMPYLLEAAGDGPRLSAERAPATGGKVHPPRAEFSVDVPLERAARAGESMTLKLSVSSFECKKGGSGFCRARSFVWEVPVTFTAGGSESVELRVEPVAER